MAERQRYFEPAETQYNEFVGTCAFDEPHSKSIEEVFELPKEKYWVLGFSLHGGAEAGGDSLGYDSTVYVVERSSISGYAGLEDIARSNGGVVPVIEIRTLVPMKQVLELCKRVSIRAESHGVHDEGWRLLIDREHDYGQAADDVLLEAEQLFDEGDDDTGGNGPKDP
jgi:hypothetical protein